MAAFEVGRLAMAAMALLGGLAQASDPVIERGLSHTERDSRVAEQSIVRASKLIADAGPRLVPSWRVPASAEEGVVPVYLVEGRQGAILTPAAVPSGCRCIFVSPSVLEDWVSRNSTGLGRMSLDKGNFLVFVLLHEAGHLLKQTPSAAFRDGEMSQLNVEPSRAKAAEEDADDFAAEVLKRRSKQAPVNDVSIGANWVVSELTKLSWNMQGFRSLDEFGAFAIGKPSVYFDNSYTHPNLAWRILRVNNLIQQSEATRYLLKVFEEARERGANPQPLNQKK